MLQRTRWVLRDMHRVRRHGRRSIVVRRSGWHAAVASASRSGRRDRVQFAAVVFRSARWIESSLLVRSALWPARSSIKAGGNHSNLDMPIKAGILYRTENDISFGMRGLADDIRGIIDLHQRHIHAPRNVEEHAPR